MWKRTIEKKTEEKKMAEQSLNTGHKKFSKKFKGICGYCGKQGHKKETCFKKKRQHGKKGKDSSNNTEREKGKVKNPNIICFCCKHKGHPARIQFSHRRKFGGARCCSQRRMEDLAMG
jgi:hypothetical protein